MRPRHGPALAQVGGERLAHVDRQRHLVAAAALAAHHNHPRSPGDVLQPQRRDLAGTLEILAEIDAAQRGEVGAILRREGLYSSLIAEWRKQRDRGALAGLRDRKPGPKADPVNAESARLREENAGLRERVATCEELIATQGRAFALLQAISTDSSATPTTPTPNR
jgi:transposase-like protein